MDNQDSNQSDVPAQQEPGLGVCEVTGRALDENRVVLKDIMGDNHYFENYNAVSEWALAKANEA